jgi:Xaa-Pro aminopeptidase
MPEGSGFPGERLERLRASFRGPDRALLISNLTNIRYLTGFDGTFALLLVPRRGSCFFITDARYGQDALQGEAARVYETQLIKGKFTLLLNRLLKVAGVKTLYFESSAPYSFYERLKKECPRTENLLARKETVENLRAVKDAGEVGLIEEAVRIAEEAFKRTVPFIKQGVKEITLARRLTEQIRKHGLAEPSFPAIVASGPGNSAVPHARPTGRKLSPGDLVIVDWGARYKGYCSDMTRSFLIPGGGGRQAAGRRLWDTVLQANNRAIAEARAGMKLKDVDNSARYVIKQAGYGEYFTHGLGHGTGLDVHEKPVLSARYPGLLAEGMVFTVEPGIYLPGTGGVRIEDMVLIERGRPRVLTRLSKELNIAAGGAH